jgi:hypothetical protein
MLCRAWRGFLAGTGRAQSAQPPQGPIRDVNAVPLSY